MDWNRREVVSGLSLSTQVPQPSLQLLPKAAAPRWVGQPEHMQPDPHRQASLDDTSSLTPGRETEGAERTNDPDVYGFCVRENIETLEAWMAKDVNCGGDGGGGSGTFGPVRENLPSTGL